MTKPQPGRSKDNHLPGERQLRHVIHKLRRPSPEPKPISIAPTNALEAILIERIQQLEAEVQDLKSRVNWLILAIVGACITFIAKTLLV